MHGHHDESRQCKYSMSNSWCGNSGARGALSDIKKPKEIEKKNIDPRAQTKHLSIYVDAGLKPPKRCRDGKNAQFWAYLQTLLYKKKQLRLPFFSRMCGIFGIIESLLSQDSLPNCRSSLRNISLFSYILVGIFCTMPFVITFIHSHFVTLEAISQK